MNAENAISLLEPAATKVRDPLGSGSIWLAGMVQRPRAADGALRFDLVFKREYTKEQRHTVTDALIGELRALGYAGDVVPFPRLEGSIAAEKKSLQPAAPAPPPPAKDPVPGMSGKGMGPHGGPVQKQPLVGVKRLIVVASGKGGVGKSTVSTNLAVALSRKGFKVGLLDADVYGPSLPKMMHTQGPVYVTADEKMMPIVAHGIQCLSVGLIVPEEEAVIWRGPMVMDMVRRLLQRAAWDVDYLIVDLPPGTGDAQLTLIQGTDIHGAVIVTTPQDVALADAIRGVTMFRKLDVPLLGIVENMAYYELPDGKRDYVFGQGGGRRMAEKYAVDLLVELPLRSALRQSGDDGVPAALGDDSTAQLFASLADQVVTKVPVPTDAA